jgi:cellulose synthase (UDP-forming)
MGEPLTLIRQRPLPGGHASTAEPPFLVPLFRGRKRVAYLSLAIWWALALVAFWAWWLQPDHNVDSVRFFVNCAILFWTTVIPGYFVLVVSRASVPNPARAVPAGLRVAMVVTKAPSEPLAIVTKTLLAMLDQSYPHDTWLADEDPTAETIAWCAEHNVSISTRKGVVEYHNHSWPRRTKCKEGNLAYFYDKYGYDRYDFVSQLDADQVPTKTYLEEMLRPFADERVGYVSAPSICDSNADESWSARGRLYIEGPFHGSLQAGYNSGLAPTCIGSHYAVRTRALRSIGGLGPELAEDHSTTLIMNSKGWRGVHALNAIAHGDGPRTFSDMATQEYQWSKSLVMILIRYTRHYFKNLPLNLKGQFLFCQLWYPFCSLSMGGAVVIPAIALLTRRVWANVNYFSYFAYAFMLAVSILCVMACVKRSGAFRPWNAKLVSWEGIAFLFARWPWVMLGTLSAVFDCIRGREFSFKVTPKGETLDKQAPLRVVAPYLIISLWCAIPLLVVDDPKNAGGFYLMSIVTGLAYFVISMLIVIAHAREQRQRVAAVRLLFFTKNQAARNWLFIATAILLLWGTQLRIGQGINAILWHPVVSGQETSGTVVKAPVLGVYDPDHEFESSNNIAIEHTFVTWTDPAAMADIQRAYDYAKTRNRWLMLTIEPWSLPGRRSESLLKDTLAGAYDNEIQTVCRSIASLKAPVFVRWGQEMETGPGRYSWAQNDPSSYIASYKKFVDQCRRYTDKIYFVWSPAGDPTLDAFFPGKDYVDFIGLSIYDCPKCGVVPAGGLYSAASIFKAKYGRVQHYNLPVMITELGVDGDDGRKRQHLSELLSSLWKYPLLRSVFYFNARDTAGAWPAQYQPDWRLNSETSAFNLSVKKADDIQTAGR